MPSGEVTRPAYGFASSGQGTDVGAMIIGNRLPAGAKVNGTFTVQQLVVSAPRSLYEEGFENATGLAGWEGWAGFDTANLSIVSTGALSGTNALRIDEDGSVAVARTPIFRVERQVALDIVVNVKPSAGAILNMSLLLFDVAGVQLGASAGGDGYTGPGGDWVELTMVATPEDIIPGTFAQAVYGAISIGGFVTGASYLLIDDVSATPMATISSGQLLTGNTEAEHVRFDGKTIQSFTVSGQGGPLIVNADDDEVPVEDPSGLGLFVANRNVPVLWDTGTAALNGPSPASSEYDRQFMVAAGHELVSFSSGDGTITFEAFPNGILTALANYDGPAPGNRHVSVETTPNTGTLDLRLEDETGASLTTSASVNWIAIGW